jgi:hypothetical protein
MTEPEHETQSYDETDEQAGADAAAEESTEAAAEDSAASEDA